MKISEPIGTHRLSIRNLVYKLLSYLCITALFMIAPTTGMGDEVQKKNLSLSKCIEIALANATSTRKAANNLQLRRTDVLRNYGSFLPKLSVSTGYTPYSLSRSYSQYSFDAEIANIKTESESVSMTVTTSLNLFNGFRDYASLQSALNMQDAAGYTLTHAMQTIAFDVTQAYYQVLLDQELLSIAKENFLSTQDQLTLTEKQFQIGLKSMIERYQVQADAAQSNLSVIKAETRLERSKLELIRRLQINPMTIISFEPVPEQMKNASEMKSEIDLLISVALKQRLDLKSRELETKAAKWQLTGSRSSLYPRLDLNITAGTSGTSSLRQTIGGITYETAYPPLSDQLGNSASYSVGLNLSWSIFDGFQTRYNIQSAKINHLNQQLDYEDLKYTIIIDLEQAAREYSSAFVQIEAARMSLAAADLAYTGVLRKHELGATGFVELSTARATLLNARSNLSQATYNLALQKSVLDYLSGTIAVQ